MKLQEALGHVSDTAYFAAGDVLETAGDVFRRFFGDGTGFLVADENTYGVAGERLEQHLRAAGVSLGNPYIFPGKPVLQCNYTISEELVPLLKARGGTPIAVGSGTLNDLVKVAAFEAGVKYMVAATAASVDGYSAPGASIVKNGFKNSIYCHAPYVILADTNVLKAAPHAMTSAGYADLSSKYTAGADWIIADALGIDPIDDISYRMVQEDLDSWLIDPDGVKQNRPKAFENLFTGLTMTGLAMQKLRKSRPASGAEHLMSHIWEMRHLEFNGTPVSHGFKVAIATLAMTALMERIFSRKPEEFNLMELKARRPAWEAIEESIRSDFPEQLTGSVLAESKAKYISGDAYTGRLNCITAKWHAMKFGTADRLLPYQELLDRFSRAGAPVTPRAIGLSIEEVCATYRLASMIRNRYTSIDLAVELGILDQCADEIKTSSTYLR